MSSPRIAWRERKSATRTLLLPARRQKKHRIRQQKKRKAKPAEEKLASPKRASTNIRNSRQNSPKRRISRRKPRRMPARRRARRQRSTPGDELLIVAVPPPMTPRQQRPRASPAFLGPASLLNALLRDPALAGTLVIVNEFGEIGLDHLLVERLDGDILVMTSGCLCCSIRGDLIATLEDILRRRDNGRIAPFQRVMIETTGLADPAPVLHTVMAHPYLMLRFRVDGVVTLV